jgi:hypothetical protein
MLRRHQTFANSLQHAGCRTVAPWLIPAAASLVLMIAASPRALAAPRHAKPAPQTLWNSFPLNPTGERLGPKASVTTRTIALPSPRVPQAVAGSSSRARGAEAASSRSDLVVVALVAGVGFVALFALVGLRGAPLRSVVRHPAGLAPRLRPRIRDGTDLSGALVGSANRLREVFGQLAGLVPRPRPGRAGANLARALIALAHRVSGFATLTRWRQTRGAGSSAGGVFVLLAPKLGRLAGWTRSAVWTETTALGLLACALAVVVALLVVRFVA